jgi:GGDEF domain-containing protein
MVAKTLQNSVRSFDIVSRWGGEEYVAVVEHMKGTNLWRQTGAGRSSNSRASMPRRPSA